MKKLIIFGIVLTSLFGISYSVFADDKGTTEDIKTECKYSVIDAIAGIKTFEINRFIPKQTSSDGKRVMGMVLYHNPANSNKDSVDAIALVVVDKADPDTNQIILLVSYYHAENQTTTTYKRQFATSDGKQVLSSCFEKVTEKIPRK